MVLRRLILPGMVRRCQGHGYIPHLEPLPDIVPDAVYPLFSSQKPGHIVRPMEFFYFPRQLPAGGSAVMVVITVGEEDRVHPGDLLLGYGYLDQQRHVKPAEYRVDHDRGPPAVDQRSRIPQPSYDRAVRWREGLFSKRSCFWCSCLHLRYLLYPRSSPLLSITFLYQ